MQNGRADRGFTIVEALIVVSIIGVLMSMAAPPLSRFLEDMQASQNTNELLGSLLLARSEAVTRNAQVTMCKINPAAPTVCNNGFAWENGWIAFEDLDSDGIRDGGEEILDTNTGLDDTTVVSSANFTTTITYRPSGAVVAAGTLGICVAGNVAKSIVVTATGRPRVQDSTCP